MDAPCACIKNLAGKDFLKYKVDGFKKFLKERGIQLSDGGKGKRKAELVDLCEKAAEMKQAKLDDIVEDYNKLLEEKLQTEDCKLLNCLDQQIFGHPRVYFQRSVQLSSGK